MPWRDGGSFPVEHPNVGPHQLQRLRSAESKYSPLRGVLVKNPHSMRAMINSRLREALQGLGGFGLLAREVFASLLSRKPDRRELVYQFFTLA